MLLQFQEALYWVRYCSTNAFHPKHFNSLLSRAMCNCVEHLISSRHLLPCLNPSSTIWYSFGVIFVAPLSCSSWGGYRKCTNGVDNAACLWFLLVGWIYYSVGSFVLQLLVRVLQQLKSDFLDTFSRPLVFLCELVPKSMEERCRGCSSMPAHKQAEKMSPGNGSSIDSGTDSCRKTNGRLIFFQKV